MALPAARPAALAGTRELGTARGPQRGRARHPDRPCLGQRAQGHDRLDPGKKSPGRKRGVATDALGLLIAVLVVAANVHDNAIGTVLLDEIATGAPTVTKA